MNREIDAACNREGLEDRIAALRAIKYAAGEQVERIHNLIDEYLTELVNYIIICSHQRSKKVVHPGKYSNVGVDHLFGIWLGIHSGNFPLV